MLSTSDAQIKPPSFSRGHIMLPRDNSLGNPDKTACLKWKGGSCMRLIWDAVWRTGWVGQV